MTNPTKTVATLNAAIAELKALDTKCFCEMDFMTLSTDIFLLKCELEELEAAE